MAHGRPIQLLKQTGHHSFKLNETEAERLLLHHSVRNKKVCLISVAGAFRKGKSFLLDFFIRYLEKACTGSRDTREWLGRDNERLTGFKWRGGSERETTGIWAWSKVFLIKGLGSSRDELAVILLDTQGTFDSDTSAQECVTIFALSTVISSTLIFNVSQNIQENELQHLQYFTEYGKLALKESTGHLFQTLMFLVRDWPNPDEYNYGLGGGKAFLRNKFDNAGRHDDLTTVRKSIRDCFSKMECFLMPHPGKRVAVNSASDRLTNADVADEFKSHLKKFIPHVCSPASLSVKQINGKEMTCAQLLPFLKSYVEALQDKTLPPAVTLVEATAEVQYLAALDRTKDWFTKTLNKNCGAEKPYMTQEELDKKLDEIRKSAVKMFREGRNIRGGRGLLEKYSAQLREYMDQACAQCIEGNRNKENFLVRTFSAFSHIGRPFLDTQAFDRFNRSFKRSAVSWSRWWAPSPLIDMEAVWKDNELAMQGALDKYIKDMDQVCGKDMPYGVEPAVIHRRHERSKESALAHFESVPKEGGIEHSRQYRTQLSDRLDEVHRGYVEENEKKRRRKRDFFLIAIIAVMILFFKPCDVSLVSYVCLVMTGLLVLFWLCKRCLARSKTVKPKPG